MRIAHLSICDPFTARWVNSQAERGHDIHLIILGIEEEKLINVQTHTLPIPKPIGYYLNVFSIKQLLIKLRPDLLHVHWAVGNGILGRLSGFHPSILSVWGSDVMVSPKESLLRKYLVIKNLNYYDHIISTSKVMVDSVKGLSHNYPSRYC